MFKNLKEKIKEENNLKEIPDIPARKTSFARRSSSRQDSINSFNSLDELSVLEQVGISLFFLISQTKFIVFCRKMPRSVLFAFKS